MDSNSEFLHGIGAKQGIRYPILIGTNYIHWKFRMEYNLRSRKLWNIVSGERPRPLGSPDDKEWDTLDEEARQVIVMTVNDEQNAYLFEETTARGMWERLKEAYQETSVANTLRLKSKFNSYKMDPLHSMATHVNKVKELAQELKAVGVAVEKEDIILVLLDSLPEQYKMVKSSLKSQRDLSVELVCSRLKEEEHDLGLEGAKAEEKVFFSSGKRGGTAGIQCHNCGKFGHLKRFCLAPRKKASPSSSIEENSKGSSSGNVEKRRCFNCNQIGHLKKDCKVEKKMNAMVADGEAYIGALEQGDFSSPWIIDSGATHHMCFEKSAFKELVPLQQPRKIVLGNGQITEATHIGRVELELQTREFVSTAILSNVLYTPEVTTKLFSVSSCIAAGNKISFTSNRVEIRNKEDHLVGEGSLVNGLWKLLTHSPKGFAYHAKAMSDVEIWHKRFGHLGIQNLQKVQGLVKGMDKLQDVEMSCEGCAMGKQTKKPTKTLEKASTKLLEMVHSNVCHS